MSQQCEHTRLGLSVRSGMMKMRAPCPEHPLPAKVLYPLSEVIDAEQSGHGEIPRSLG
jgi:hypothetical protein